MSKEINKKDFIHNNESIISKRIREVVFGVEDGIVSTVGALTGIAIAVSDQSIVIISGLVIIAVESISMGMGSYLSGKSVKETEERKAHEEKLEIKHSIDEEKEELIGMFRRDGWPDNLSKEMAEVASKDKNLMFKEMSYRELYICPEQNKNHISQGLTMFSSYIIGGSISLLAYFLFSMPQAIILSIVFALIGLFLLGVVASRFTKLQWWKIGIRMVLLGSLSVLVGCVIGQLANYFK
jgi:vacuolar iron transporter family protein